MTEGEATGGARLVGWIVRERLYAPGGTGRRGPLPSLRRGLAGIGTAGCVRTDLCAAGRPVQRLVRRRPVGWEQRVSAVLGLRRPASGAGVVGSGGVHGWHPAVPVVRESVCGFAVFGGYQLASV